jgi:hypothetical protein
MTSVEALFKISVIDGALAIKQHIENYPECDVQTAVRHLRGGPASLASLDYDRASELIERVGFSVLSDAVGRDAQLRKTIFNLALELRPFWARVAHFGRQRVLHVINEDQYQCLLLAQLLERVPSPDSAKWWDEIAAAARSEEEHRKIEIGREGERRTLKYEREKLSKLGITRQPKWVALDDNAAGYDVLSYERDSGKDDKEKYIEVKACVFSPTHFILSRNEWHFARANSGRASFHVWNLETEELFELTVDEMSAHIPEDCGNGVWQQLYVSI